MHNGSADAVPLTAPAFRERKGAGPPLVCITAYDAPFARLAERAGVDAILVGDSLGTNVLGYDSQVRVTVADAVHHTAAVTRSVTRPLVIADLPFMTYATVDDALRNAGALVQAGGAAAVKLEGGAEVAHITAGLVARGIPVVGHVGLIPQSIHALGGYRAQGTTLATAQHVADGARAQADAGAFSVVLESIPARLAEQITASIPVPTIGIGAGPGCDGQIQVIYDLLGFSDEDLPRHARVFASVAEQIEHALGEYARSVQAGEFPTEQHGFKMKRGLIDRVRFD